MAKSPQVAHDIGAKLWSLCHVLRDDGVTYHQYLSELTYLNRPGFRGGQLV